MSHEGIQQLYREHGTIDAVVERTGLPRAEVVPIIDAMPDREAYRLRGTAPLYAREELLRALQRAAVHSGEPLTIPGYRKACTALGLPTDATIVKHFVQEHPDHPWQHALKEAGVTFNPPRGRRGITRHECVEWVRQCITTHSGERVSYAKYTEWAMATEGAPSGATVRKFGWGSVLTDALT